MRKPTPTTNDTTIDTIDDPATWHPLSRRFAWIARPGVRRRFIWWVAAALLAVSVAGVLAIPILAEADHLAPWDFFAGWTLWGLLGFSLAALAARPLATLINRPEGYYGPDEWTGGVERAPLLAPTTPEADGRDVDEEGAPDV